MATVASIPASAAAKAPPPPAPASSRQSDAPQPKWTQRKVISTLYDFPTLEPVRFLQYRSDHLHLPLRRDLLHRAVVFEGDRTRQGTASTKWRNDVRGSSKKIRPQKGTGRARLGDRKSPSLRGGGVAHGPHPRDFSTGLPRKVYDKALRTALSYRYRRGQLIIINNNIGIPDDCKPAYLQSIIDKNQWGSKFGRSLLVTEEKKERLAEFADELGGEVRVLDREDVDVKDLLKGGRVIIEKIALEKMIRRHSSDIDKPARAAK